MRRRRACSNAVIPSTTNAGNSGRLWGTPPAFRSENGPPDLAAYLMRQKTPCDIETDMDGQNESKQNASMVFKVSLCPT